MGDDGFFLGDCGFSHACCVLAKVVGSDGFSPNRRIADDSPVARMPPESPVTACEVNSALRGSVFVLIAGLIWRADAKSERFALKEGRQTACKPGSVRRPEGRVMAIHLGRPLPDASRDRPGRRRGNPPCAAPIWSCSGWGLACQTRYRVRGALLPHPFTLTTPTRRKRMSGRFAFCATFPGVAPAGRYPAPCFRGARTFLPRQVCRRRPSGHLAPSSMGMLYARVNVGAADELQ